MTGLIGPVTPRRGTKARSHTKLSAEVDAVNWTPVLESYVHDDQRSSRGKVTLKICSNPKAVCQLQRGYSMKKS